MALEIRGQPILSWGEFTEMMKGMSDEDESSGILQAWFYGEDLDPDTVHACLDIEGRGSAETERAAELVEIAMRRIENAFPGEVAGQ